jgi:flagellin
MVALQSLSATNRDLLRTQNAISTGMKVANAKDNGAIWAISNKIRSDVSAYDRVIESNEMAAAKVDVAIAAGEAITELLVDMKGKALAASQIGLSASSQAALNADFIQLRDQVSYIILNSQFDGASMLTGTALVNGAQSLGDAYGGNNILIKGADLLNGSIIVMPNFANIATSTAGASSLNLANISLDRLGEQLAEWGTGAKRLEAHKRFVSKLQDALNSGIGGMVDADLAKESARLQATQVKQQLGVQALALANGSTQSLLALFRN